MSNALTYDPKNPATWSLLGASHFVLGLDAGLSCRQAARFGVSTYSAIRWQELRRAGGDARPKMFVVSGGASQSAHSVGGYTR